MEFFSFGFVFFVPFVFSNFFDCLENSLLQSLLFSSISLAGTITAIFNTFIITITSMLFYSVCGLCMGVGAAGPGRL